MKKILISNGLIDAENLFGSLETGTWMNAIKDDNGSVECKWLENKDGPYR